MPAQAGIQRLESLDPRQKHAGMTGLTKDERDLSLNATELR